MAKYTRKHINRCVESATYQTGSLRLDRDAGIVYGVKVLGWSGKNGTRVYQRRAVESACKLYDRVPVNLNHAKVEPGSLRRPDHDVTKRFGRIINPRVTDDGLYADLKYNRRHWFADTFTGWVEDDPGAIGLSHDAILQGPTLDNGSLEVQNIPKVFSVDLVGDPGSTRGLHEDATPEDDDDGLMEGASQDMDDLHSDEYGDADEHLCSFIVSVVKDQALSFAERIAKIKDAMKLMSDGGGDEGDESKEKPKSPKPDKKEMSESKATESASTLDDKDRLELDDLRREKFERGQESKARELCMKAELDSKLITPTFVGIMIRAQESAWEGLIADRKLQVGSDKPTSTPPTPGGKVTRSLDDFEKFVRGESK